MVDAFKRYLAELLPPLGGGRPARTERYIRAGSNFSFLLAVSGGLDSVVMVELFRLAGYTYSIAHCNFQLRGEESDEDEKFVKKLAAQSNMPFFSVRFDTGKFCLENKLSVQMGARQLRYNWLESERQKSGANYIVTAHHADDAIETFFINMLRGTGISGLHGIRAIHEHTIRPMLHFHRQEIEQFAQQNNLLWREDSSNSTDKYERNKIRHHLLPALEEINPDARKAIYSTIEKLAKAELVLNDSVDRVTQPFISKEGNRVFIHFNLFKELIPAHLYLYKIIKKSGFNYEQCIQIAESVKGQPGKLFLSPSHRLAIDREALIMEPLPGEHTNHQFEVGEHLDELFTNACTYLFLKEKMPHDFTIPTEPDVAALDFDKLTFPLKIRTWEKGDKFYPLGMTQPKKVSDFLVDSKVSVPDKEEVRVLVSEGQIAWLIGYRIDDRFKVTKATKKLYLCKSQKIIIP